jgi:YbgC/YbaW family acyl-CoA thioester hydrolase
VKVETKFRFQRPIKVIFRDLDGMRHVNHAVYLTYCEAARNEYWIDITGIRNVDEYDFVLAELTARYLAPAQLGDELIVSCGVTELRRSSFLMGHEIHHAQTGQVIFEMTSAQVMFDYKTGTSMPIPAPRRKQVEEYEGRSLSAV